MIQVDSKEEAIEWVKRTDGNILDLLRLDAAAA